MRRSPRMCESTVRWPDPSRQPHTSASSCSRVKTAPGRRGEHPQQLELGRRQVLLVAVDGHAPRRGIEVQRAVPDAVLRVLGPPLDAPQQRAHARDQLARRERLRHVVVGADAEPDQHVRLAVARRQHQHRHLPLALHPPAHLEPVEARQHQVEHHQVRPHALAQRHAGGPIGGDLDLEPLGPQPRRHRSRDDVLVLDHADHLSPHAAECARTMWTRRAETVQVPCRPRPPGRGYTAGSARM